MIDIRQTSMKCIVRLGLEREFYGHIIQQFEKVFVSGGHWVKTAAVGRIPGERFLKLYLNDDYFRSVIKDHGEKLGREYIMGVLEHEALHCFPARMVVSGSFLPIEELDQGSLIVGSDGGGASRGKSGHQRLFRRHRRHKGNWGARDSSH